jgi:hypothetical protein
MFYMANDTGTPFRPNGATARVLEESSPQVVLSHCNGEASTDIVNGVYWVSPGNAGLDAVDCSVTVIEVRGGQPYFEVVDLESGPG